MLYIIHVAKSLKSLYYNDRDNHDGDCSNVLIEIF